MTTLTPRYVLMLVGQLPAGSALSASMQGGQQYRPWTLETHLLAATVNLLFVANSQRARKKSRKLPVTPPKPKVRARPRRVLSIAGLPSTRRVAGR